jgi:hypothetical protein
MMSGNLYGFVLNNANSSVDFLGLATHKIDIVTKSFINGVGPVGHLSPRWGGIPYPGLVALLPIPIKTIIQISILPKFANLRLHLLAEGVEDFEAFNQNPFTPAKDGKYRLYSRIVSRIGCCNGQLRLQRLITDKDGGYEALGVSGTINLTHSVTTVDRSSIILRWFAWGKPNDLFEPGMQWVGERTSLNIWHRGKIILTCLPDDTLGWDLLGFEKSRYPSHRVWIDGNLTVNEAQGAFSDLWRPASWDKTFVSE